MGPLGHAVISGAVGGGIWAATGSESAAAVAVGVGVLIDVDHVYDFYQWYVKGRRNRFYVLLHGWEYSVGGLLVLAAVAHHPLLWATILAHLAHVCTDQFSNPVSPFGYSIIYRSLKGFDRRFLAPNLDPGADYRKLHWHLPFGQYWEAWFERKVYPWFDRRVNRPVYPAEVGSRGAHSRSGIADEER